MDGNGIQPTYDLAERNGYYGDGFGFGGGGLWLFAILALMWGGFGGNRFGNAFEGRCATVEDLNNSANFTRLENQVLGIGSEMASGFRNVDNAVCQLGYRDLENTYALSKQISDCCCENRLATQQTKFDMANYAAGINTNIAEQTQKVLDAISQNKIESLQARINQLELAQATCGVVRYPTTATFASHCNPFASFGCGCGSTNI